MWIPIALIAETLAILVCFYGINGERFRPDGKTLGSFFSIFVILEVVNSCHLHRIYSILPWIILFVFCKTRFPGTIAETIISFILGIVIVTSVQFLNTFLVMILRIDESYARDALVSILSLTAVYALSLAKGLNRLKKSMCRHSKFVMLSLIFMSMTILAVLLQMKFLRVVHMQYYLLAIPAILLLLYAIFKWDAARSEAERMKESLDEIEEDKKNYEDLLTNVRLQQHALKNHMETISSFRYTQQTKEGLAQTEEDYCNQLRKENKYTDLLLLGDEALTGFLYGKFRAAGDRGIEVDYRITAEIRQCLVPVYHVIEMLGILFDNAMEAVNGMDRKEIFFTVGETDKRYEFVIRNPFQYVPYKEIEEWFGFEKSGKGSGRGLGLYHLKCLCREWNCEIGCRNQEIDRENWIVFSLSMGKG